MFFYSSRFFCCRVIFFICASRIEALLRLWPDSVYTKSQALRPRKYFAPPLPVWCCLSRRLKSVVIPVYSESSFARIMYTYQPLSTLELTLRLPVKADDSLYSGILPARIVPGDA